MRIVFAVAMAVLLGASQAVVAQNAYPSVELLSTGTTVVGEPIRYPDSGPARVTSTIVTLAPHSEAALHLHPAPMYAYILEGEVVVDYGPHGRRTYVQGQALMETMAVPHKGINATGRPVRILCVFMGAEGTANVSLVK
ncbi:double-stranded beta-helix domain-containing protein [Paramagnetospirillum caucaseum]|uniref:Double-stranded beta-helix domain-containing protein n=1 Tax=Paramagnetospirillum caucaseum TaxID=1244869 RepID=M3ACD2_9PROT|nr:cupin domain-containing protein [Paramagnetospirillum caucaseum]EME70159.1 double-stranded beta-helix domain-containing protein [Paramagnetospirillum caucaseum]